MTDTEKQLNSEPVREIDSRIIRIKLINDVFITGQLNIKRQRQYGCERLSDLLTRNDEQFLVLFSATESHPGMEQPIKHKTIFVNKQHILWAAPDENQK